MYDTTLSGLSKVTNFLRGSVVGKPVSRPGAQTSKTAVTNPTPPEHLCHRLDLNTSSSTFSVQTWQFVPSLQQRKYYIF